MAYENYVNSGEKVKIFPIQEKKMTSKSRQKTITTLHEMHFKIFLLKKDGQKDHLENLK